MNTYGYIRVSSRDQNEDRQLIAMREIDVPEKRNYHCLQIKAKEICPDVQIFIYLHRVKLKQNSVC